MVDYNTLAQFIKDGLKEDIQTGDITSNACIKRTSRSAGKLLVKDNGVLAGVEVAKLIFEYIESDLIWKPYILDGVDVKEGDVAFELEAGTRNLLKGERLALNIMQRMSGIASLASRFSAEVEGFPVKILDTRKTTPLNRMLEKWAVRLGGCYNYRDGLYDWFMIKDNHIKAAGTIKKAIKSVKLYQDKKHMQGFGITVEVKNLNEVKEVLKIGGITRIMFDNFEIPIMREAVLMVNKQFETEASGGITLENVRKYAETGVDYISVGALTHSAGSLDLSLKII